MRLLPGQPTDIAGESITSYSLVNAAINNPDVLSRVWQVFKDEDESPISAFLASKGYFTKNVREGIWNNKFRVVKSNHVMYPIANTMARKIYVARSAGGKTFEGGYGGTTTPGKGLQPFYIYLTNNWARPKETLELNDNTTQLYIYDDQTEPVEVDGVWRYEVKLITNDPDDYCDPALLEEGSEVGVGMTLYEHDFSETASEKYSFHGWGHSYLTLQRVKMSFSGTAEAMASDGKQWYAFQNSKGETRYTYIEAANREMMKRATKYHEYQLLWGKTTVSADGKTMLTDKRGREIMAGDGLLYGHNGAIRRPMTHKGWTMAYLDSLIEEIDVRANHNGEKEAIIAGGYQNIAGFHKLMYDSGFVTQDNNVEGRGDEKGVNMNYKYFSYMGVKLYPLRVRWFDSPERPSKYLSDGKRKGSFDGMIVPLGNTEFGDKTVELIQLRPPKKGSVYGINRGGDGMASSVDGQSDHFLWQTGIIRRCDIIHTYMPYNQ
jgi:hypothetical protein